ncbi:ATP-binding protein [Agrobacterium pusense]|uniref:ATP-binding protein n=1 Tax=Agrobacterium pusense TaxID=648995 RepID=UPI00088ED8C1|nr:ATP-binding protein [Agrobacterium pusense]OOO15772.1 hypothetical protein BTE56_22930 [Agrobacterium pusense]WKD48021.1 ATP-binding protein [Agrobacterium pusense]SDF46534.1 Adenylylsulphate kinase [Agrobacterium pusense]
MDWYVRAEHLNEPSRQGGDVAERGFEFQRSYAVLKLVEMLIGEGGLCSVRYEGAQDVDLMLGDGTQSYVQIKDFRKTDLDWPRMKKILAGFVRDEFDATVMNGLKAVETGLRYQLIGVGLITNQQVFQILRKSFIAKLSREIVCEQINCDPSQQSLYQEAAKRALSKLSIDLAPRHLPERTYRLMTEAHLIRFGVLPAKLDTAISTLTNALTRREPVFPHQVADWLSPYLPESHPGAAKSAIRLAPISDLKTDAGTENFFSSQTEVWAAISAGLDVRRDSYHDLSEVVLSPASQKVFLTGPSGSGKSTLARRVLWDLQRAGKILALEFMGTEGIDQAWSSVLDLARAQKINERTVVVLVDDIFNHRSLVELAATLEPKDNLKVLATAWRVDRPERFKDGFRSVGLAHIRKHEAQSAAEALHVSLDRIKPKELERLLQEGQFLVLNLALLGNGTSEAFGRRLVERITDAAPEKLAGYLDLCAAGVSDASIPRSLMAARGREFDRLDEEKNFKGLVFAVGEGEEQLRSGHRLLAEAVLKASGVSRIRRLLEIAEVGDFSIDRERRFAIRMLDIAINPENSKHAPTYINVIRRLCLKVAENGDYVDCKRVAAIMGTLGDADLSLKLADYATAERVNTGRDAATFRADSIANKTLPSAFPTLLEFYERDTTGWGYKNFVLASKHLESDQKVHLLRQAFNKATKYPHRTEDLRVCLESVLWIKPRPIWLDRAFIDALVGADHDESVALAACKLAIGKMLGNDAVNAAVVYSLPVVKEYRLGYSLPGQIVKASEQASSKVRIQVFTYLAELLSDGKVEESAETRFLKMLVHAAPDRKLAELGELLSIPRLLDDHIEAALAHYYHRVGKTSFSE